MKKTRLFNIMALAVVVLTGLATLTSCDGFIWAPAPPSGWNNNYVDPRLYGSWKLVQANSAPVYGDATNYMEFNRGGRGVYYYYRNGSLFYENMAYWCQSVGNSASTNQINIQYSNGSASTMNYWFSDGNSNLWMQWYTNNGTVTYVYRRVISVP